MHPNATLLSKSERLTPSINEDMLNLGEFDPNPYYTQMGGSL